MNRSKLNRSLGLMALAIYGLGDILGAGIYAIIGQVAGVAGRFTWISFLIALAVTMLTALSYAELGSRWPRSGGATVYVGEAFRKPWLSMTTGCLVLSAAIVSMATLSRAFLGYIQGFGVEVSPAPVVIGFFIVLALVNFRGIKQSSWANMVCTAIEVTGLLIVVGAGAWFLSQGRAKEAAAAAAMPLEGLTISQLVQGAALAFYAFIGFEDLANIAEEAKRPERNLPRAILIALGGAGLIYIVVAGVATSVLPPALLENSKSPLLDVVLAATPNVPSSLFALIATFAVANTCLLNYVTASRLLYGMAESKLLPTWLSNVHPKTHTPWVAIAVILPVAISLGLFGTLGTLASSTSALVLAVFAIVNGSLVRIKLLKTRTGGDRRFSVPIAVPAIALILNVGAIFFLPPQELLLAGVLLVVAVVVSALSRLRR